MAKNIDDKVDYIKDRVEEVAETVRHVDKELASQKVAFEDHMKQDERMYEEFKRMNDILQQNTESLKEHMYRTDLLEDLVIKLDKRFSPVELSHIERIAVKNFMSSRIMFMVKVLGGLSAGAGLIITIKTFFGL